MGSLTLSQMRVKSPVSGWGSWKAAYSGSDVISVPGNPGAVVYSAGLTVGTGEKLSDCSISVNLRASYPADTFHCYLYDSDPSANDPSSAPSGYIGHVSVSPSTNPTFSFTGLNIRASGTLYFWFTIEHNSSYAYSLGSYPPQVSGTFANAVMALHISPATVSTGGSLSITVDNGSGASLTAVIKYGSTELARAAFTTGYTTVQCLKSWFDTAGVTLLTSMTLSVEILGGDQQMVDNFTLTAGNDMKPTVGTPTVMIVQPTSAAGFPNTWLANISYAKVTAAVTLNTNSPINTVKLSYSGGTVTMTRNSSTGLYEGTTEAPITGNTTFTVTATDRRGMSGSNSAAVSGVVPYTKPTVTVTSLFRCNSSGTAESGGTYYSVTATATYYSALSGNSATLTARIKNGTAYVIASGVRSILSGMNDSKSAYTVVVTVTDSVGGTSSVEITLNGIDRNVVVTRSSSGTYLGVGAAPSASSGGSTIELPADGRFLIGGEDLLLKVYPVGAVYISASNTSPATLFGGTWTSISLGLSGVYSWKRTA